MLYLFEKKVVIKALRAKSIHVSNQNIYKICTLRHVGTTGDGLFREGEEPRDYKEIVRWMAPEVIESSSFSAQSDIWGYGVLVSPRAMVASKLALTHDILSLLNCTPSF